MTATVELPLPGAVFEATLNSDSSLRRDYLYIDGPEALHGPEAPSSSPGMLLERSAALLEIMAVSACLIEALYEPPATPRGESKPEAYSRIRAEVLATCGLDLAEVMPRSIKVLNLNFAGLEAQAPVPPPRATVVRSVKSFLEACPLEYLESTARSRGLERFGHRCRVAFDALRAFILRNDQRTRSHVHALGRAYAQGVLSVSEVGDLLGSSPSDTVFLLEERGYQRSIETIRLGNAERAAILDRIRQDRLNRDAPDYDPARVARDVVSSERVEGIDARRWVPLDS